MPRSAPVKTTPRVYDLSEICPPQSDLDKRIAHHVRQSRNIYRDYCDLTASFHDVSKNLIPDPNHSQALLKTSLLSVFPPVPDQDSDTDSDTDTDYDPNPQPKKKPKPSPEEAFDPALSAHIHLLKIMLISPHLCAYIETVANDQSETPWEQAYIDRFEQCDEFENDHIVQLSEDYEFNGPAHIASTLEADWGLEFFPLDSA